jgi:hypothetical protein
LNNFREQFSKKNQGRHFKNAKILILIRKQAVHKGNFKEVQKHAIIEEKVIDKIRKPQQGPF